MTETEVGIKLTDRWSVSGSVRYVEFTDAGVDFGGHGYFVKRVSGKRKLLFTRIFQSGRDLQEGESTRKIYVDCDESMQTCSMGGAATVRVEN